LTGRAADLEEAEDIFLDEHLDDVVKLVQGHLTDTAYRAHPLVPLPLSRGRRDSEDSVR
jgi:hypothetical protein